MEASRIKSTRVPLTTQRELNDAKTAKRGGGDHGGEGRGGGGLCGGGVAAAGSAGAAAAATAAGGLTDVQKYPGLNCVCVYYCRTYYKAVRGGEGLSDLNENEVNK